MKAGRTTRKTGGSVLAIDAGNTRIKWGVHDGARWQAQGWVATSRVSDLKAKLARIPAPRVIMISNVAGAALRVRLRRILPAAPTPRWIKSARKQCGVSSSYAVSSQLGCDRWAALIGAYRLFGTAAVVVNAGTALTVDAVTGDGVFAGGIIVPGVDLMRRVLADNTAALKQRPGKFGFFPDTTRDAIVSGAINASCGAIERMARFLEEAGQAPPLCVLSGGGAPLLAPHLNLEVKLVDNLVLEGLLTIADAAA
jgi:type III pantothenate kinase